MNLNNVLLISTYDLGHQPFGLASPAAWLQASGANTTCLDLAIEPLDEALVARANLIALYIPMHTATKLAAEIIPRLRQQNPTAHLCCFGLYAPTNEDHLRQLGVDTILGGEFETSLLALYERIASSNEPAHMTKQPEATISLDRQQFLVPNRSSLPGLNEYAQLLLPDGSFSQAGYTEASRGCQHLCRHCPIVPIYNGRFRIIQQDIVLSDIRQQVAAGAQHITFGDPDFLNGPGHAIPIVEALHSEFPDLSYDVTIKIEHLLKYDHLLPILHDTGCLFITSAVEAVDDHILGKLDKGHTRADFIQAVGRLRELDLVFNPTFVTFTPWTTLGNYMEMLSTINALRLVDNIAPIQYAIRLLIPAGSRLLELPEIERLVNPFNQSALYFPWQHPDPRVDQLYERIFRLVRQNQETNESSQTLFANVWQALLDIAPDLNATYPTENIWDLAARPVPRLSESWY